MGTLKDYYESDCKEMNIQNTRIISTSIGTKIDCISFKIHFLVDGYSKYISIYSGSKVSFQGLLFHLEDRDLNSCDIVRLMGQSDKFVFDISRNNGDTVSVKDLVFTKKIILYIELILSEKQKHEIKSHALKQGVNIEIRDITYADLRSKSERPLAFVSHAKSDSRDFALKLTNALSRLGCPVWFDEYSLKIGDSLIESIDTGLKETNKCIFILSPDFLSNESWCKHEFKTTLMKQIFEKRNIMLPIWHGIKQQDVYKYSPILADAVGVESSLGEIEVAKKISKVLLN